MTDGARAQTVTIEPKQTALDTLRDFAQWAAKRDGLVCAARRAGASYDEIIEASKLSRGTVTSILTKAGLVGQSSSAKEAPVTTSTAPGMSARFFPHHPHFVDVKTWGDNYEYRFREFTGAEPQPEMTGQHPYAPEAERTADYQDRLQEWDDRQQEIDAALKMWQTARYHREITPLVAAALKARPPVDQALADLQEKWDALNSALVWPVAVKQVLEAQKTARAAMSRWVDDYAYPLAKAEGMQPYYVRENVSDWHRIAIGLNGGQSVEWDIGWYYAGDQRSGGSYSHDPLDELDQTLQKQRAELTEIAKYTNPDPTP